MPHLDPDVMALLAMGEPVATSDEADHLSGCGDCADELANLRHAAIVGRSAMDAGTIESPPEAVWGRIANELGLASAVLTRERVDVDAERPPADHAASVVLPDTGPPASLRDRGVPAAPAAPPVTDPHLASAGAPRRTRPGRMRAWALAAAVVMVAGVGLGSWALTQGSGVTEVAEATLAPFPNHQDSRGDAVLEEESDGSFVVRVQLDAEPVSDTFREVWLIRSDATALVSLGVLDGSTGTFAVPADVDIREYVLVDISQEPLDGDANHSGDSIVRGELGFA